jgi:hypothetical protein
VGLLLHLLKQQIAPGVRDTSKKAQKLSWLGSARFFYKNKMTFGIKFGYFGLFFERT